MDPLLNVLVDQFNNREIAVAFWLLVLLVWALRDQRIRKSLRNLLTALLQWKVVSILLLQASYVFLVVLGLEKLGIWNMPDNLKDTVVWAVTVAFGMLISINDALRDEAFFRRAVRDALKLTIVLEFVIGLYPFSLLIEFVLIPVLAILGALLAISEMKPEYSSVKRIIGWLVAIAGLLLLWHSLQSIVTDWDAFASYDHLIELILPSLLTILFLPFLYLLALFLMYESIFIRLRIWNQDPDLIKYAKLRLLLRFGFNLSQLQKWSKKNTNLRLSGRDEVLRLVAKQAKPLKARLDASACSISTYRTSAEPIMTEFKNVISQVRFDSVSSREPAVAKLEALLQQVHELPCRHEFPLKHETLVYTIKHALDALRSTDEGKQAASETAINRAMLNRDRFDDWSVDVG